jgi:hypothetical protein
LPDGLFSKQKSKFGKILEGLAMKDVGVCILWPFGIFYRYIYGIFYIHWVYLLVIWCIFYRFGMLWRDKSGNPDADHEFCSDYIRANEFIFSLSSLLRSRFSVTINWYCSL